MTQYFLQKNMIVLKNTSKHNFQGSTFLKMLKVTIEFRIKVASTTVNTAINVLIGEL
jgi:hypothetical protein